VNEAAVCVLFYSNVADLALIAARTSDGNASDVASSLPDGGEGGQ
jgi:hypothetical protein